MPKSNVQPIRPADSEALADQLAAARDRIYQAIAIIGVTRPQVGVQPTAALQAASEILDRAWSDLGQCARDAEEGT